jgi:diguanylate cyclase (GGDEF)-like protein
MAAAVSIGIRSAAPGWALRRDFARLLVVAVVLPALILCALLAWAQANTHRTNAASQLHAVAEAAGSDFDDFFRVHGAIASVLAERRSGERTVADRARWTEDLRRTRAHYPAFSSMRVFDARGALVAADPGVDSDSGVAPSPCFLSTQVADRAVVSDVYAARGEPARACVGAPLRVGGRFAGVVDGAMPVAGFVSARAAWLQGHGFETVLVDRRGQVAYASDAVDIAAVGGLDSTAPGRALDGIGDQPTGMQRIPGVLRDDADAYAVAVPLQVGWRLYVLLPKRTLDTQLWRSIGMMLGLLVTVAAGVLGIAWWQMRRLSMSVHKLLVQMQRFALDHASAPIAPDSMPQELAPLADAMNQLTVRLSDAYLLTSRSLEEQQKLRASLEQEIGAREREITQRTQELRNAVSELDRLSRTDALTGCLNYRGFREVASGLWRDARNSGTMLSALALDIDYFKAYNDRYGHPRGDNALKRFAGAVRSALYHREDVVVRPGGEEFIVFLPDTTLEQAMRVGERICASVLHADIAHAGSPSGVLTVSIGVATNLPEDGDDPEVMLARADAALYRAKNAGRNRVSL